MEYRLKKSLGQHFLKDENVCKKMVEELQKFPFERLLEVGPGGGALTKYLLKIPSIDFKAVEVDNEKVLFLTKAYPAIRDKIIHADFLEIASPFTEEFMVAGNFPYNISTQILFKITEWKHLVPAAVGMFQKEVAERAASKEGSKVYGVLSVLLQAFYKVEYLFDVGPASFTPPPKVMSGVIRLTRRNDVPAMRSEKAFFNLVKTAFNQRRKTLRNAVKSLFAADELKDELFNKRAEVLSVEDFAALTFRMM
jgi:16S rRNA (adenine1518-N6/adenine1519-N6)-dimethyltransferase